VAVAVVAVVSVAEDVLDVAPTEPVRDDAAELGELVAALEVDGSVPAEEVDLDSLEVEAGPAEESEDERREEAGAELELAESRLVVELEHETRTSAKTADARVISERYYAQPGETPSRRDQSAARARRGGSVNAITTASLACPNA